MKLPIRLHRSAMGRLLIIDAGSRTIARVEENPVQAEFMVRACNAHDPLVKAAQDAQHRLQELCRHYDGQMAAAVNRDLQNLISALTLATTVAPPIPAIRTLAPA